MDVRRIIAALVGLTGLAWFLQGIGVLTVFPSFMVSDIRWAVIGAMMLAVALWLWRRD